MRDLMGRLRRESWLVSKKRRYLDLGLQVHMAYRNLVRKRFNHDDVQLSILDADETAAIVQHGQLGRLSNATVVLVRGLPADDIFEYARLYIRVFDYEKKVAEIELGDDSYPCALILDDFDGIPGNEVAVSWLSVANGYTAGVTVFRASYERGD